MTGLVWVVLLASGGGQPATGLSREPLRPEATTGVARLVNDPRSIAAGLFLDTPLPAETVDRSLAVLAGLRCRYGLVGGVRDDEEAATRAFQEVEALEFTPKDIARMADRVGVSLAPTLCGAACENLEQVVLLRLRIEALERLAAEGECGKSGRPRPGDDTESGQGAGKERLQP